MPDMLVGFNYPYFANFDGYNIGPWPSAPPGGGYLSPAWAESLPRNLGQLRDSGVSVVRVFLLGNGLNYGPAATFVGGKWRFAPPDYLDDPRYTSDPDGKVRRFADHYRLLLQAFKDASRDGPAIKVVPSVLSFDALLDPADGGKGGAGGKADVVENADARRKFLEQVVKRLVDISVPFKEWIYAFEIINEPSWGVALLKPHRSWQRPDRVITYDDMKAFLEEACTVIESAGLESTVGHRFFSNCLSYPTGSIAQYHYYPRHFGADVVARGGPGPLATVAALTFDSLVPGDPIVIPRHADALAQIRDAQKTVRPLWKGTVSPVIVGEFGSDVQTTEAINDERLGTHGDAWFEIANGEDRRPEAIVGSRLTLLSQKGYPLAMVWPHLNTIGDGLLDKMAADRWASLRRFTGGRRQWL